MTGLLVGTAETVGGLSDCMVVVRATVVLPDRVVVLPGDIVIELLFVLSLVIVILLVGVR